MKTPSLFLLGLFFSVALVGAGCTETAETTSSENTTPPAAEAELPVNDTPEERTAASEDVEEPTDVIEDLSEGEDTDEPEEVSEPAPAPGQYTDYDATTVSEAAENGDAVLFFHASWCPTCKTLNDNLEASASQIPDGVSIFKTDYDTQTELKQLYGVTYQHTMVQVGADGKLINKWSGGNTLEDVLSNVQ